MGNVVGMETIYSVTLAELYHKVIAGTATDSEILEYQTRFDALKNKKIKNK